MAYALKKGGVLNAPFILSLLNISGIRLFNSLNLSMTLVSGGGFLPTNSLNDMISTNVQKFILIFSLLISLFNFYLLFNIICERAITSKTLTKPSFVSSPIYNPQFSISLDIMISTRVSKSKISIVKLFRESISP